MTAILMYINIVTDGLDCQILDIKQTTCPETNVEETFAAPLGSCSTADECAEICDIWAKSKFDKEPAVISDQCSQNNCLEVECASEWCNCKYIDTNDKIQKCNSKCPWR